MMSSTAISNNQITDNSYRHHNSLKQTKKSKMQRQSNKKKEIRPWRSKTQEQVYKSKLLQPLQHVRLGYGHSSGRAVHEVANRVLAITAKGRTRWSRAILKYKSMKQRTSRSIRLKKLPRVQRKARDLSRLIPGCRKQPLLVVLEEVADYVSALNMQVKVMADVLSERSSSGDVDVSQFGVIR